MPYSLLPSMTAHYRYHWQSCQARHPQESTSFPNHREKSSRTSYTSECRPCIPSNPRYRRASGAFPPSLRWHPPDKYFCTLTQTHTVSPARQMPASSGLNPHPAAQSQSALWFRPYWKYRGYNHTRPLFLLSYPCRRWLSSHPSQRLTPLDNALL